MRLLALRCLYVFSFSSLLTISFTTAYAGVCCGGGSALTGVITGYEDRRFSLSSTYLKNIGEVDAAGSSIFYPGSEQESKQSFSVQYAQVLNARTQAAIAFGKSAGYWNDLDLSVAYALVPRLTFDTTEILVLGYGRLVLPSGHSVYELKSSESLVAITGTGFTQTAAGWVAQRTYRHFDFVGAGEVSRMWSTQSSTRDLQHSWKSFVYAAAGWSFLEDGRVGLGVRGLWQAPKKVKNRADGAEALLYPVDFSLAWFQNENVSWTFQWSDETLLGPVKNSALSRSGSLTFSYRGYSDL